MESGESRTIAILAEKPSVAQDIARVLGANACGKGYLDENGYVATWAIGHLVSLAQPHEIKPNGGNGASITSPSSGRWLSMRKPRISGSVRSGAKDPRVQPGFADRLCDRRRARGRTDLPLYLRGGGVQKTGQPALDFRPDSGRHPHWVNGSTRFVPGATTIDWRMSPAAGAERIGWSA